MTGNFGMPTGLPTTLMDPLSLNPPLGGGLQHQADSLGLAPATMDEGQHWIMPNSATLPHSEDVIDDHLIDPSEDARFQQSAGNSYANGNYNRGRSKSNRKKRMMLQTRNFMNMTMAQMVSDPHHYKGKNIKIRQGGAMTPQRIERGPNARLDNQSSSGAKSSNNLHYHLTAPHKVSSFTAMIPANSQNNLI